MKNTNIKSRQRVKDLGEVFTADSEVQAMLDMLPTYVFTDADKTFLEPSCGTGNFVCAIFQRKVLYTDGTDHDILERLSSIYGVDISEENIVECRKRLFDLVEPLLKDNDSIFNANKIIDSNIRLGDFLKMT